MMRGNDSERGYDILSHTLTKWAQAAKAYSRKAIPKEPLLVEKTRSGYSPNLGYYIYTLFGMKLNVG